MAEPNVKFGAANLFGALTGWEAQDEGRTVTKQRANTLDHVGNEVASNLFDEGSEYSQSFKAADETAAPAIPPSIGKLIGAGILTQISINTTATDFATMQLTGHNHAANAHADNLRNAAHGIVLDAPFGAKDFLGGTAGSAATVASSTITIGVQHVDKPQHNGNHFVGENFDCRITATTTWTGTPTTPAAAGWDVTSVQTTGANTDFEQTVVTAEKAITLSAPRSFSGSGTTSIEPEGA